MEEFRRFEEDGGGIKRHRYKHHFKAPGDRKSRQFQVRKKDFEVSLEIRNSVNFAQAVCNSGFREKLLSVGFHQWLIVGLVMTGGENGCAKVVYPSSSVGEALYRRFVYTNSWRKRTHRRNPENHLLYQLLLKLQLHILHNVLFRSLLEIETLNAKGSLQMDTSSLDFIISMGTSQDFPGDKLFEEFSRVLKPGGEIFIHQTLDSAKENTTSSSLFYYCSHLNVDGDGFNCGGCRTLLMYTCGARSVRFSCCVTVNLAPVSNHLAHVNCGYCRTMLMYPFGAALVKCVLCHYITNANDIKEMVAVLYSAYRKCNTSAQSFSFYMSPVPFSTSAFYPTTPQLCHHDPRHRRTPLIARRALLRYFYSEIQKSNMQFPGAGVTDSLFESSGFGNGKYKMKSGWLSVCYSTRHVYIG
ncbi:hypothetical protein L1887_32202 [Cichorium endivia]|nr:hypothetical protein L1887_32202 [Cichorium endivia]